MGMISFSQTDVLDARGFGMGQTVTVSGVATNGSELGSIRYLQDHTAGIAGYGGSLSGVMRGDLITITGVLVEFSGLLEISPVTNVVNHGQASFQIDPLEIPITSYGEPLESQLVTTVNVTFNESGNFSGNTTYTVSDGSNNLDVRINPGTNLVGTPIPSGPISITGLVGQFNADYQIVPRDLNDIVAYVAPQFEINVLVNGTTVLNGETYFLGNTTSTPIVIENSGASDLIVSGSSISGTNAGDFSSDIVGGNVSAGGNVNYTLTYTASVAGSVSAALEIVSNDTDENPYIIYLEAVGTDDLATEPSTNPTNLTFPTVEAFTLNASYTGVASASDYIVLWKENSAITDVPTDGVSYKRGDVIGSSKIAYVGSGEGFTPRGIVANRDYYFAVFAFNGSDGFENYQTTTPLEGNVSSLGKDYGNYYDGVNAGNSSFVSDLTATINPHNMISYFLYKQTMMAEFEARDTTDGRSFVTCGYSGERKVYDGVFDWNAVNFSREHTYPHSWMQTFPADNPEQEEYTDQHNLYPINFSDVNAVRSNYPFGIVVDITSTHLAGTFGKDVNGKNVYEPQDSFKGNVARAIMYHATSYNGTSGNWGFPNPISQFLNYGQDQDLIKAWHLQDLPDDYEIARNEYIYNLQGNRNPFVDSVELACFVDFTDMSYLSNGCISNVTEINLNEISISPNPASEVVYIKMKNESVISSVTVFDLQGRLVYSNSTPTNKTEQIDVSDFTNGSYIVVISTDKGRFQTKLIVD